MSDDLKDDPAAFAETMFGPVQPWRAEVLRVSAGRRVGRQVLLEHEAAAAVRAGRKVRMMRLDGYTDLLPFPKRDEAALE